MNFETTTSFLKTVVETERVKAISKDLIRNSKKTVDEFNQTYIGKNSKFCFKKVESQKCGIIQQRLIIRDSSQSEISNRPRMSEELIHRKKLDNSLERPRNPANEKSLITLVRS